jgi:putative ABC transport system permease protein
VGHYGQGFVVTSAATKLRQVEAAERQTQFLMLLVSAVALFTAFFIILSTLSMGMVERMGQLGTLRCLGMTRVQMAWLVLGEAVALGLVGIILGIPVGLGLGRLTVYVAREYVGFFAVSRSGLALAVAGGAVTTLAGAILPMLQTMRVSPLVAARPQALPAPGILAWICCLLGAGMIAAHTWMLGHIPANVLYQPSRALTAVALLYCGYAFLVPAAIRIIGLLTVRVAAAAIRIRYRLLADQVGKAVWRSSAICCGLMVGLSLIVTLVVHGESIVAGWDFPKNFCEAFVFISPPAPQAAADNARRVGGVAESCLANPNIRCTVYGKGLFNFPFSLFIAGDPDEFFRITNLEFVAGSKEDAIAKLRKGGCVLVTPEFVRAKKLDYGDHVGIKTAALFGTVHRFEIAGVVTSPALDIAANYFNAGGQLMAQSVLVVLGTFADARKVFGVPEEASLVLLNFDLPATAPPP